MMQERIGSMKSVRTTTKQSRLRGNVNLKQVLCQEGKEELQHTELEGNRAREVTIGTR